MDKEARKRILIKYGVCAAVYLVFLVLTVITENPFAQTDAEGVIGKICNCFTVPGIICAGVGALSYISYLGGYDSFGYAFTTFGLHNIWTTKQPKKYKTFYDYKQEKDEKGRKWLPEMLFIGLGSIAIGLILLLVYYLV